MLTVKNPLFFIFFLCLLVTNNANSTNKEKQYVLQKIAQAPQLTAANNQWLLLLEQPGNSKNYYLTNKQGEIYQLVQDSPDSTSLLLNLQSFASENPALQLSAFTLHPNFSLRGQVGFGTFYTAHVEKATNNSNTKRLLEPMLSLQLPFDAVVTEWQLNLAKKVDNSSQREVLRIAIPTLESGIRQLNFNPHSKSWQEDFSQLYISLSQSVKLKQHPLYSGAILRIHPQKNATESYTVSHSNPYFANEKIDKALYLFGAGQIKQFIWPSKHTTRLLISHQYNINNAQKYWVSYSDGGEDWRKHAPEEFLYQSEKPAKSLLVYRGRNAPSLRNKLLLLAKNNNNWQINSLSHEAPSQPTDTEQPQKTLAPPLMEWQLTQQVLQANHLTLYRDNRGELLFFNEDSGAIYQLFQQDITLDAQKSEQTGFSVITILFAMILALLSGYIFYQVSIQKKSAKSLVRREFSNLSLTEDKLALNLYKRHQREIEKVILLTDIKQFQIILGDLVIATINTTLGHGFNQQQEQALREIFHKEQIAKMVDGKVRRISLSLHAQGKNKSIICLYLRKGSDRITKKNYFSVVDDTINWCWLIANEINSEQTGKRVLKPKMTVADIALTEHKTHDNTPLHTQAANVRPTPKPNVAIKAVEPEKMINVSRLKESVEEVTLPNNYSSAAIESAKIETDLVNALEKLVKLHQQGFLTADEFKQAKAKLYNFN